MNEQRTPAELLALRFHETYERLAPQFGYETRPDTKAFDPTTPNGRLMIAVCGEIAASPEPQAPIGHSEQWWLHRLDMEKTAAWQQGYAQGIYRATHPSREAEPTPDKRLAAAEPVGIVLKRLRTVGGIQETIVGPELFEAFKDLPANTYLYAEPPDWEAKLRSFWQSWSVSKEQAEPLPPNLAWRDHDAAIDSKALATATEISLMWGQDRSQFVSRIQVAVTEAMRWLKESLPPSRAALAPQPEEQAEPLTPDQERDEFYRVYEESHKLTGHKPSHFDVWLIARGRMDTNHRSLAPQPDRSEEQAQVPSGLTDEQIETIGYSSDPSSDFDSMSSCLDAIHSAETNGGALAALAKFRKAARVSAVRAALAVQPSITLSAPSLIERALRLARDLITDDREIIVASYMDHGTGLVTEGAGLARYDEALKAIEEAATALYGEDRSKWAPVLRAAAEGEFD